MDSWFHKQSKLVQVILLVIPVVNWFTEILVRWSAFLKKGGAIRFFVAFFVLIIGIVIGWIDAIVTCITNKLVLE